MKYFYLLLILFLFQYVNAQYKIDVLDSNTFTLDKGVVLSKISFRGLSVVDDKTIWVSGSRGTIARSVDGGKTFHYSQIKGYEKSDFRDIEAFDDKRAIMMSSGTPAYILKTIDGGQNWKEVYKNLDTAYFLDAMDFWNEQKGIIVGDPIHKHFLLLQTNDGGETWQELDTSKTPIAFDGEAVFAASGTSLRVNKYYGEFVFVSGGSYSVIRGANIKREHFKWKKYKIPIIQGKSSTGAFSVAFDSVNAIVVGGDYEIDSLTGNNSSYHFGQQEEMFVKLNSDVFGYRSCVEAIHNDEFIACGTTGGDIFRNKMWRNISKEAFHVVRKSKKGKAVFLAGPKGKIGKLVY